MREELKSLQSLNARLTQKSFDVEDELKKTKQELEQLKVNKSDSDVINYFTLLVIYKQKIMYSL